MATEKSRLQLDFYKENTELYHHHQNYQQYQNQLMKFSVQIHMLAFNVELRPI